MKYLCKWSKGLGKYLEWEEFQEHDFSFFSDKNGYSEQNRFMIERLRVGDVLDLSEGGYLFHEIERLS